MTRAPLPTAPAKSMGSNVLVVLSGSAGAQVVLVICLPFIARLYTPADFGLYSYLSSIAIILAGLANLRLDAAVPLPRSSESAADVVWLATISAAAMSLLVAAALMIITSRVPSDHALASRWIWTLPLMVFVSAQFVLWNQVSLRNQLFTVVARRPFLQNVGTVALQLGLVPARLGVGGLLLGQLIARVLTTGFMIRSGITMLHPTSVDRMIATLRRYSKFPLLMAPAAVLNTLGIYLPLLLVTHFYGKDSGGTVGLAQQLVMLPASTLGSAVAQVYMARLGHALRQRSGGNLRTFIKASLVLASCGFAFGLLVTFAAPGVLPLVLGPEWVDAGPMAAALCPASVIGLVAGPMSSILVLAERVRTILVLDLLRVALVVGVGLTAVSSSASALQAVLAMSLAQALVYLVTWLSSAFVVSRAQLR